MTARTRARVRYHERKRQGLCVRCGEEAVSGKTLCVDCREVRYAYLQARYQRMAAALRAQENRS